MTNGNVPNYECQPSCESNYARNSNSIKYSSTRVEAFLCTRTFRRIKLTPRFASVNRKRKIDLITKSKNWFNQAIY